MKQITVIKLKLCILWALISVCKAEQNLIINTNHENSENSGESVWTVFETNLKNHSFCTDKDAVLIVGNGGSGKTTLISHLTDPNLPTYRVDERINFGDMEIFEAFGVTEASSEIIVPKFVADTINGIDYYNCPSFSETKNIANNVLMKYSTKQLLECSNRVKFVFVIDHLMGRSFEASRDEFLSVAQQAINLMKNMDKYRNSIALVVTKVQNSYTNNHGQYDFISDQVVIDTTANFLINVKSSLKSSSLYNQHVKEKIIGFIDILLEKKDKDYIKIGMSRVQDHPTPQNLELLQLEKQRLVTIINGKLQYVDKAEDDFSFEMAEEMKNHIFELIDDMQKHLIDDLSHIDTAIKEFYEQKETNISDIFAFDEEIASGLLKLSQIRPNEPKDLLERLTKVMHDLNICIPDEYIDRFTEHIEYVNILRNVSNTVDTFIIPHGLKITTKYLDNAKKWYSFIIQLSDVMDRYSAQSKVNLTDIADLFSQCSIDKGTEININEIGLQTFLDQIGTDIFRTVENMRVNSYMLKALKATVGWANIPIQISCSPDKLMVKGHNIKISDLIHIECLATVSFIEVFAMNKLFVDASINEIGHKAQVSFIAPTWEIIGEQKVYLSGENATAHLQPHAEIGMNGLPGQPGGSAGHFIGIGNAFTNDKQLEIVGIGGNGGDGQHGGDQHTGIDAAQSKIMSDDLKEVYDWFQARDVNSNEFSHGCCTAQILYSKVHKMSLQVSCENQGNVRNVGGNGGSGGLGGDFGKIVLIGFEQRPKICTLQRAGENGEPGKAGHGGIDGYNSVGLAHPEIVHFLPLQVLHDYKTQTVDGFKNIVRKSNFQHFMTNLEENSSIRSLINEYKDAPLPVGIRTD